MQKTEILERLRGKLIVSCQALKDEPLYGSEIMAAMARAALEGGAAGIRANSAEDIRAIRKITDVPMIGLLKRNYQDSNIYITPTFKEIEEIAGTGIDIIAMDATDGRRPNGVNLQEIVSMTKNRYPSLLLMADCSCLEDGIRAEKLGFDFIGTTMCGYTEKTRNVKLPDFELIKGLSEKCSLPVIAEGGIWTPDELKKVFESGAFGAVIGTAITRPREITKKFTAVL